MRVNPNSLPCTRADADKLAEEAFYSAIACGMSTIAETEAFTLDELQELWNAINASSDDIANGKKFLWKIVEDLEKRYGITVRRLAKDKAKTMAQAKKQAKASFSLACAIILDVVARHNKFSDEDIYLLWQRINYKYDSVQRRYTSLYAVCEALEDEYNITVGGVLQRTST